MGISEYLLVFVSIILALAVGELVQGLARIVRPGSDFGTSPLFWLWFVFLAATAVTFWWNLWSYNDKVAGWSYLSMWVLVLGPVLLYLMAELTFSGPSTGNGDSNYFAVSSRLWAAYALFAILGAISSRLSGLATWEFQTVDAFRALAVGAAIVLTLWPRKWVHIVTIVVLLVLALLGTVAGQYQIS